MELTGANKHKLRGMGQRLEPLLRVGREGVTEPILATLGELLDRHELVKVRFVEQTKDRGQRGEMADLLVEKTGSTLIATVGHVAVLFRRNADPAAQQIAL